VVKGAFVELPRYFADTGRVQDLESRLLTCMENLQGLDAKKIAATPFGKDEQKNIEGLVAWISAESKGMKFNLPQGHPKERAMYEVGKRVFFMRAGTHDFACASCHGADDKRIRLQDLPNLTRNPGAGAGFGAWPAYRVSSGELWSMQRRLNDCFRQQRFPYPGYASDVTIALGVYMGVNGKGGESTAPAIKR
jgi:sulfur-oxidizing protein SoxA